MINHALAGRLIVWGVLLPLLSGCALLGRLPIPGLRPRLPSTEETTPTPPPAPTPQPTPPMKIGPSSDEVWLVEMMAQRLELAALEAWSIPDDPATFEQRAVVQSHALTVQWKRLGLPDEATSAFFNAQFEAAAQYRDLLRRMWKNPRKRPSVPPVDPIQIDRRRDAIDLQILATFRRMGGIPYGRDLHRFTIKTLIERGFKNPVAKTAAASFGP